MSDEPTPTLRLKPRVRPEPAKTSTVVDATVAATPPVAESNPSVVACDALASLSAPAASPPALAPEAITASVVEDSAPLEPLAAAPEAVVEEPSITEPSAAAIPEEPASKLRLKSVPHPAQIPASAPPLPPMELPKIDLTPLPPTATLAAPPTPPKSSRPASIPKPIHLSFKETVSPAAAPAPEVRPERRPAFRVGVGLLLLLCLVSVGAVGFFGYRAIRGTEARIAERPKNSPAAPLVAPVVAKAEQVVGAALSAPGKAVEKARDILAHRRETETARVNEVLDSANAPPKADAAPVASTFQAVVSNRSPLAAFADAAKVSGVFQGNPARAMINGRTYRVGALVDAAQGIVFSGIDPQRRELILTDARGESVTKKY